MKLFVWDFHGVLEKGNDDAVVEITNLALQKHGYARRLTPEESKFLSGRRWHEYFAFLYPDLDRQECFNLQATCFEISKNQPDVTAKYIRLNDHVEQVLKNIQYHKYTQIIISNTPPESLDLFVKIVGLEKYFPPSHRFGVNTHTQQQVTKKDYLQKFLNDKHFPEGIVSIGDSPSDVALIHDIPKGIGYLYTHPGREHRVAECHYKIDDLRHVLQELPKETLV